jgi:hypothetical protein
MEIRMVIPDDPHLTARPAPRILPPGWEKSSAGTAAARGKNLK